MLIFSFFRSSFTNSGSSNRAMELPMNGGGSSHGGGFNNGMNPFPYSNSMHNNMYMPNSNSYRSNDRSSRQVQQQAFNRNNRNIRRGRRLSRRGKLDFFFFFIYGLLMMKWSKIASYTSFFTLQQLIILTKD